MAVLKTSSDIINHKEKKHSSGKKSETKAKTSKQKPAITKSHDKKAKKDKEQQQLVKKEVKEEPKQVSLAESVLQEAKPQVTDLVKKNNPPVKNTGESFKICGIAFLDQYQSSIYKKRNKGINNIEISLYDQNNKLIATAITKKFLDINGYYEFNNIPSGKYKILISVPYDMEVSRQLLQYSYGSKINPKSNSVIVIVSDKDITDAFIGLYFLE